MRGYRKGRSCIGSCIATCSLVLLSVAVATPHWLLGNIYRASLNHVDYDAGNKTFGLFTGCQYKRYGKFLNYRKRCFNSFTELSLLGHGILLYISVTCICTVLACQMLIMYNGIYNELVKSVGRIYIVHIPFAVNIIAFFLNLVAVSSFAYLYQVKLKHNVLHDDEIHDGFTSKSKLCYSFWLSTCSCVVILLNIVYMWKVHVLSHIRLMQRNNSENVENFVMSRNEKTRISRMSMIY